MSSLPTLEISLVPVDFDQNVEVEHFRLEMRLEAAGEIQYPLHRFGEKLVAINWKQVDPFMLDPQSYGQQLFATLFDDEVELALTQLIQTSRPLLRIRLLFAPGAEHLHRLGWEALRGPDGIPLTTNENILFSRYLGSRNALQLKQNKPFRRALVAVAAPTDLSRYDLAAIDRLREQQHAQNALRKIPTTVLPNATLNGLMAALRDGADLLYLVCHGKVGPAGPILWLEDGEGRSNPVAAEQLASRVQELKSKPLLAILCSCESGGQLNHDSNLALSSAGPLLSRAGIPAVIAFQGQLSLKTAAAMMPVLLEELLRDGVVDRALAVARGTVREHADAWRAVLYMRLKEGQLWTQDMGLAAHEIERAWFEPETVYIPAGTFLMGTPPGSGTPVYEQPKHEIHLEAYRIGRYPVSNKEFASFVQDSGKVIQELGWVGLAPPPELESMPVTGVNWYLAQEYCVWLSRKTGRNYVLPNEAEWEKAARGPHGTLYPWGEAWLPNRCNNKIGALVPVDAFAAQSPYGCYDMVGNAREWTCTLWGSRRRQPDPAYQYETIMRHDPSWSRQSLQNNLTAGSQVRRIYRGGTTLNRLDLRASLRRGSLPDTRFDIEKHGLRVAIHLE